MTPEIITTPLVATLVGASKKHDPASPYGKEIISLLDRVWPPLRAAGVKHTGHNWVIYDPGNIVFAGVEVDAGAKVDGLETRTIRIERYAKHVHVGPYAGLHDAHAAVRSSLASTSTAYHAPVIEVYGHWNNDESKLETELIYPLV